MTQDYTKDRYDEQTGRLYGTTRLLKELADLAGTGVLIGERADRLARVLEAASVSFDVEAQLYLDVCEEMDMEVEAA